MGDWRDSGLWQDQIEVPAALRATLSAAAGFDDAAAALGGAHRVVATGNGAAYYVAQALWLASLSTPGGPPVAAVPAGLIAHGGFRWQAGDRLLAISSSGEFRDVLAAFDGATPRPAACITATAASSLAQRADAVALQTVLHQRAVTHTQAFCGGVLAALAIWARITGDGDLAAAVADAPAAVERALAALVVPDLAEPTAAVVFGSGCAWAAALEGALLLKEVPLIPTEGCELREGATTAMYALRPGHLVLTVPVRGETGLDEAEALCAARGATVVRVPGSDLADARFAPITAMPALVAFAASLAHRAGHDIDHPAWEAAYYQTARNP